MLLAAVVSPHAEDLACLLTLLWSGLDADQLNPGEFVETLSAISSVLTSISPVMPAASNLSPKFR